PGGGSGAGDLAFLLLAFGAVGEHVPGVARAHDASACQGEGDAGGVDGDPATAPLFGDVSGGAGAACRVENAITRSRCHQQASFDHVLASLDYVDLVLGKASGSSIHPEVVSRDNGVLVAVLSVPDGV